MGTVIKELLDYIDSERHLRGVSLISRTDAARAELAAMEAELAELDGYKTAIHELSAAHKRLRAAIGVDSQEQEEHVLEYAKSLKASREPSPDLKGLLDKMQKAVAQQYANWTLIDEARAALVAQSQQVEGFRDEMVKHNGDGNCDIHSSPGVLRDGRTESEGPAEPRSEGEVSGAVPGSKAHPLPNTSESQDGPGPAEEIQADLARHGVFVQRIKSADDGERSCGHNKFRIISNAGMELRECVVCGQRGKPKQAPATQVELTACRGCGKPLLPENIPLCDGCPCNCKQGANHGLVPKECCTCDECFGDNEPLLGGVRYARWPQPLPAD